MQFCVSSAALFNWNQRIYRNFIHDQNSIIKSNYWQSSWKMRSVSSIIDFLSRWTCDINILFSNSWLDRSWMHFTEYSSSSTHKSISDFFQSDDRKLSTPITIVRFLDESKKLRCHHYSSSFSFSTLNLKDAKGKSMS